MSIRLCPGDTTLSERRFCCHKSKRMGVQIWLDVDGNFDEEPEGRSEGGENRQAARTLRAQKKQTCNARKGNRRVNLAPTQARQQTHQPRSPKGSENDGMDPADR